MIRAQDVAVQLAGITETVALMLLPNGKRQGAEWCVGSVGGEAGESLKVHLAGGKIGVWCDFATGQSGDLLDLWAAVRSQSIGEALRDAKDYLGIRERRIENPPKRYLKPTREGVKVLEAQHLDWLASRCISHATALRFKLASRNGCLMFPYLRENDLFAAKYRRVPAKEFRVDADCQPGLFGWHALTGRERSVVLCEGEMDALAFAEYNIPALSVPFGGGKGGKQVPWIETEFDRLAQFDELFIAMDNDLTGAEAVDAIVQRLGRERCRIVTLPRKDANECLMDGIPAAVIVEAMTDSKTRDPEELRQASDYADELEREFTDADWPEDGIHMPWRTPNAEKLLLRMEEVSIWPGINGHGKSQVMGHITANALVEQCRCCVASMEFRPAKWLKRVVRQVTASARPSRAYVRHVAQWFHDKLWVFAVTGAARVPMLLEVFAYAARRYGVKFFVIDNLAKCGFDEDDYNGQKEFIDRLTEFAKEHRVHVALVCHMRKTENEDKPAGKMGVKGSGGVTDMCDTVVEVWRNKPKEKDLRVALAKKQQSGLEVDQKILDKPDCLLICSKQRNGDAEPTIALWFDPDSYQYLQHRHCKSEAIVGFKVHPSTGYSEP